MPHMQDCKEFSPQEIEAFKTRVFDGDGTAKLKQVFPYSMIVRYYMRFRREMSIDKGV